MASGSDVSPVTGFSPGNAWPKVSVIVATRGRPQLLRRAVVSILGQAYPGALECVLVFDQTEPADVQVDVPSGRRLRVLTNTRTPGLAGARNTGIAATDGALIAFCDDDDTWQPSKIAVQAELLERSAADFAACGVRIHHGEHVATRIPPAEVGFDDLVRERITALIHHIPALANLPAIANCDFGHTTPILTLPIGGHCRIRVGDGACGLWIERH